VFINIIACIAVSRQGLSKHVPSAKDMHAPIEVLLETIFFLYPCKGGYKDNGSKNSSVGREPPFREDLSPEAED
jgi:hypothetical protein